MKIDRLMDSLLEKVESKSLVIKGPILFFSFILYILIHPIKFVEMIRKVNRDVNYDRYKNITKLKEEDIPIYFPDFKKYNPGYWRVEFSLGNGIEIIFDTNVLVYINTGNPDRGYSTFLYEENPTWGDIERCLERYQTDEFKKLKNRESRIDEIIGS